jgi:hypothetical protein
VTTIREHLGRRTVWVVGAVLSGWLLLATMSFALGSHSRLGSLLLLFGSLLVATSIFLRCPRCNGNLGVLIGNLGPLARFGRVVKCCPYCEVSLDEQI